MVSHIICRYVIFLAFMRHSYRCFEKGRLSVMSRVRIIAMSDTIAPKWKQLHFCMLESNQNIGCLIIE